MTARIWSWVDLKCDSWVSVENPMEECTTLKQRSRRPFNEKQRLREKVEN
jgi:hypothetical protein